MNAILSSLGRTVTAGVVATAILAFGLAYFLGEIYGAPINFLLRWFHVLSAIMWIGLLWYFNFVQIPAMPKIPDASKPAITGFIAPSALFWFRWAALATIVTGLLLASVNGYLIEAMSLGILSKIPGHTAIGIGMWLGLIMAFNVWFVIWPKQKIVLGIAKSSADEKKAAGKTAMMFSRINTLLSIPMLYAMVSAQSLYQVS